MTHDEVEDLILGLLAERAEVSVEQLRAALAALGDEMPIDSLLAVEILVLVQNATGVVLPATEATAQALLSVRSFVVAVMQQLDAQSSGRASA
ncbi:acyl carrier protein [Mycolicibacterium lacusdiani]|uniref:acyl carrier protein n=1 Tax=Mycolicibacterium lacusdiani TaxID=2895283 RepID=UPI001F2B059D|nr:hypothetical protein [Mycolicibacterium lacusdiani]